MLIGKLNLIHDAYEHAELEIEALTRWKDLLMGQVGPKRGPARVGQRWRLPFCLPCGGPSPHQKKESSTWQAVSTSRWAEKPWASFGSSWAGLFKLVLSPAR